MRIEIPFNYEPREYQLPFWQADAQGIKRFVLVHHRRAGKEKTCWNFMIKKAFDTPGVYYYFFPHFSQARKIIWDGMDKNGFKFIEHIPEILRVTQPNATEMKIKMYCKDYFLHGDKSATSVIQLIGTNNYDSIRGTNPRGCVFSEYALQDPRAWDTVRPILTENGGWAVFNFTPLGFNFAKDLFDMAKENPSWFCQLLTVNDTKINGKRVISDQDIQEERLAGMSEDFIQQEFFCSFNFGIEGSYYAKYLQKARQEGRIGVVPWENSQPVHVSMDIGFGDDTALIFYQILGHEIAIIDTYSNRGMAFSHYAKVMREKPYVYGSFFAPHDARSRTMATGLSLFDVASGLGFNFTILPTHQITIESGIEAARSVFERVCMDEKKCSDLLKALENYRKHFDASRQFYKETPIHDWTSHYADAFRYLAIAYKLYGNNQSGIDDKAYDRLKNQYLPPIQR